MKLNIHLVSHPIIQSLSSITINKPFSPNIINHTLKQLGFFIAYESIRDWVKVYTLTIRQTGRTKTITIIDPKESYTIISNEIRCLNFFQDIQLLLPKCEFELIGRKHNHKKEDQTTEWPKINQYSKIIIINYDLESEYTLNILRELNCNQEINTDQIRLTCIKCSTNQLITISKQYSKLNIYTTKITNN